MFAERWKGRRLSFDLGNNSGITIGAPIAVGSGSGVIGS
jgi:hypothetical protein